jgi:dihydrofolate reductase
LEGEQACAERLAAADTLLLGKNTYPWPDTTRIVRRTDAHAQIAELKESPGKEILVFGSRTLWNDLLAAGLVDELHLMIGALALGGGTPAFATESAASFRLLDTQTREGSSNLLVRYATTD